MNRILPLFFLLLVGCSTSAPKLLPINLQTELSAVNALLDHPDFATAGKVRLTINDGCIVNVTTSWGESVLTQNLASSGQTVAVINMRSDMNDPQYVPSKTVNMDGAIIKLPHGVQVPLNEKISIKSSWTSITDNRLNEMEHIDSGLFFSMANDASLSRTNSIILHLKNLRSICSS